MSRPVVFSLPVMVLLAIACKKDQQLPANTSFDPFHPANPSFLGVLQGQWKWVNRVSWPNAPDTTANFETTTTAASLGITEFLDMNANLTWAVTVNGVVIKAGTYKIDTLITPAWPIASLDFVWQGKDSTVNHSISSNYDTLWTSNMRVDSLWYVDMYVRSNGVESY